MERGKGGWEGDPSSIGDEVKGRQHVLGDQERKVTKKHSVCMDGLGHGGVHSRVDGWMDVQMVG